MVFLQAPRLPRRALMRNPGHVTTGAHHYDRAGLAAGLGTHLIWGVMPAYLLLVKSVPAVEFVAWRILIPLPLCLAIRVTPSRTK